MYNLKNMKDQVRTEGNVECPIKGCATKVPRMTKKGLNLSSKKNKLKKYFCKEHEIFISPSTFEYRSEKSNLLSMEENDFKLWEKIKKFKRESRVARERSEDALTWNVFTFLKTSGFISNYLHLISKEKHQDIRFYFWSYDSQKNQTWQPLYDAREEFGEVQNRSTEPDLIISTASTIFFIEAKFDSSNRTPSKWEDVERKIAHPKSYKTGGDHWFEQVFETSYENILRDKKYELLRLWLLGSWIAKKEDKKFVLANLVLERKEKNIIKDFGKHINSSPTRIFQRNTWEAIYEMIVNNDDQGECGDVLEYFRTRTLGYKTSGKYKGQIQKAFFL